MHIWNKVDICGFLLSNEASTALFLRCLQNVAHSSRTNVNLLVQEETLKAIGFQRKKEKRRCDQSKYMPRKTQGLCPNIFIACRRWRRRQSSFAEVNWLSKSLARQVCGQFLPLSASAARISPKGWTLALVTNHFTHKCQPFPHAHTHILMYLKISALSVTPIYNHFLNNRLQLNEEFLD